MQRPQINTTVYDVDIKNFDTIKRLVEAEAVSYPIYTVNNDSISTCPMCFDTETTKAKCDDGVERSFIYMYQLQVGNITLLARTADIMIPMLAELNVLGESYNAKFVCGIANISYEWSFLCKKIMAMDPDAKVSLYFGRMDPLTAELGGIKFVDIVRMANSSLAKIGKDYCTTQKMKGDLDYDKIRNSITPLTDKERMYCINDVVVGAEYLASMHEEYTLNEKPMPTTSTGIPRAIMKEAAYELDSDGKYVYEDVLDEVKKGYPEKCPEYDEIMKYLFRGGYTHGNDFYAGMMLRDIEHVDYTSDYPACMLHFGYPTKFTTKKFEYNGKNYDVSKWSDETHLRNLLQYEEDVAFYATFEFTNLKSVFSHSVESIDKVIFMSDDAEIDNRRISSASKVKVMLTEQDFKVYTLFYTWDKVKVTGLHVAHKKPLPMYVLDAIVKSYVAKCRLKNEKERLKKEGKPYKHISYVKEKALLNAIYGCTVERIHIEDRREVYVEDLDHEDVISIKLPVPARYLLPDNTRNIDYMDNHIPKALSAKYGYTINNTLRTFVRKICKDIYNGKVPKRKDDTYMNVYNTVIEKLKARAYNEDKNGTKTDEKGHRIGKPKMLSCWWGIWCTSYARARLLTMMYDIECFAGDNGYDYIVVYCDTDSMFLNCHQDDKCWAGVKAIIDAYNAKIENYNNTVLCKYDNSGLLHDIGAFDWESPADVFKQLGAKRYLQAFRKKTHRYTFSKIPHDKTSRCKKKIPALRDLYYIESTVAGLSKDAFSKKVSMKGRTLKDKFDFFADGMIFSEGETGKLSPTYYTQPYKATVTDEYGNTEVMEEDCGQVLGEVSFEMCLAFDYAQKVIEVNNRVG